VQINRGSEKSHLGGNILSEKGSLKQKDPKLRRSPEGKSQAIARGHVDIWLGEALLVHKKEKSTGNLDL